jgi:cytosine/adenosine deaminase-related metal-dependent hydrolase
VFVEHLGLSPLEAITCGTATSAIALEQQDEVGTLEPGRRADVLVVDGDPSTHVSILGDRTRLRAVYCRGKSVELGELPERKPLKGERTMHWSAVPLTWELAHELPDRVRIARPFVE